MILATLVTVATYYEPAEALVAQSCLRAYGIIAILPECHHASIAWHHVLALGGLRLCTLDATAEEAKGILAATGGDAAAAHGGRHELRKTDMLVAAAAWGVTGLPLPLWKRRRSALT